MYITLVDLLCLFELCLSTLGTKTGINQLRAAFPLRHLPFLIGQLDPSQALLEIVHSERPPPLVSHPAANTVSGESGNALKDRLKL